MGQTGRNFARVQDGPENAGQAQAPAGYGSRGVPADWYVDPADPAAAERYRETSKPSLEDQATAFLAAHEALTGVPGPEEEPVQAEPAAGTRWEPAVWIGLPGLDDDGELSWQADALCAQTDPEAFFPEKGGSTRDAKKVCGACTVRAQCLEYALANDERFGIWGGLSERERRRLRKRAL
ncbi:WhiB family transcriptional regulator [Arthrobacter sp. I2-34]|uniref:Transcriptional regulator WhiB n=1 Tax=Arthrobacter hankyongi TaxID=2904801 RepID=A0ABS9L241_9MICC|nr:WhiB family transcriptional regulator [Arthrobacter hankyongi]MCG2620594.1 WhiB family transcriptional regulator [Arthrobacter hankyongi]